MEIPPAETEKRRGSAPIESGEVVLVVDGGRIVDASGPMEERLGRTLEEILGTSVQEVLAAAAETNGPFLHSEASRVDGSPVLHEARLFPVPVHVEGRDLEVLTLSFVATEKPSEPSSTAPLTERLQRAAEAADTVSELCELALAAFLETAVIPESLSAAILIDERGCGHLEVAAHTPGYTDLARAEGACHVPLATDGQTVGYIAIPLGDDLALRSELRTRLNTAAEILAPALRRLQRDPSEPRPETDPWTDVLQDLHVLRDKLTASVMTRRKLLAGMGFDVVTPMGAILEGVELCVGSDTPEHIRDRHVERIRKNAEVLKSTVGDLLEISAIDAECPAVLDDLIERVQKRSTSDG